MDGNARTGKPKEAELMNLVLVYDERFGDSPYF